MKALNSVRIVNLVKLGLSYLISRCFARSIHWGMPAAVSIEPVNYCNLACPECYVGNERMIRQKSCMNIELHQKIINELGKYLFVANYYFQGEPFLNQEIFKMIKYANHKKIYTITSTNAHFLNDQNCEAIINSGLDRLIISVDGITPEIYQIYRKNGNFENVINGIKTIISTKKRRQSRIPEIIIQFVVLKSNQHQIHEVKSFCSAIGVQHVVFKSAQIEDFLNGNNQIPDIKKYSRYKKNFNNTYTIKSNLKNHCWRMWHNPVVTVSGELSVCCFDKDAAFMTGNLNQKSFGEIWHSKEYNQFRNRIFRNRKSVRICNNCTEGLRKVIS